MFFRVATIAALAGFVSANSISIGCMNTLMTIATHSEISQCLAPNQLLPILVGAGNTQDSVISPIDTWLNAMCPSAPCSTGAISALASNLTAGCSTEFDLSDAKTTMSWFTDNYWTARKVACLKTGSNRCVTQTLKALESETGTMNLNDTDVTAIAKAITNGLSKNVLCSDCNKGSYSIITAAAPSTFSDSTKKAASDKCGAKFVDGGIPSGLTLGDYEPAGASSSSSAAPSPTSTTSAATTTAPRPSASIPVGNGTGRGASVPMLGVGVSAFVALLTGLAMV